MTVAELSKALAAEELLTTTLRSYAGRWVAIRDHEVVADAETLRDLLDRIKPEEVDRILEVIEDPGSSCLF